MQRKEAVVRPTTFKNHSIGLMETKSPDMRFAPDYIPMLSALNYY